MKVFSAESHAVSHDVLTNTILIFLVQHGCLIKKADIQIRNPHTLISGSILSSYVPTAVFCVTS